MANPNVEAAYFWVQIGQNETNEKFKVKGSDFPNVAKGPEMVWVQRGDDHYWTWYGQPDDVNSPDLSYRFNYFVQGFNEGLPGNQRTQPNQDGQINFSLYFEAPGPYPTNEWRNIRNDKAGGSVQDLDGKTLVLKNNTEIQDGDVCRITHSGGMENWYVFGTPDVNNYLKFKETYTKGGDGNDADRPRVDIKRTGNRPAPDGTEEVVLSIYKKANLKPFTRIADTDWLWAQKGGVKYKVSGKNFKELFKTIQPNFEVTYGTAYFNMRMHDSSKTYQIERQEDGRVWNVSGSYTNSSLGVGNYFVPMDGCQWFKLEYSNHAKFEFKPNFNTSNVTCMFKALFNCTNFNSSVNHFDMSNCTNTSQMFYNCQKFNQSIAEWDLSTSTNLYAMFNNCRGFNSTATNLKVGSGNCVNMFRNCTTFNKSISGADFSRAQYVRNLFYNCTAFNQPISGLDFSNAHQGNLGNMWRDCTAFNQDFTGVTWPANARFERTFFNCVNLYQTKFSQAFPFPADTDAVIFPMYNVKSTPGIANWTQPMPRLTEGLFAGWRTFNQSVSHLDLSECESFSWAFSSSPAFNASDIGDLDVSGVKRLEGVFNGATGFKRDISNWDVSECESFAYMFANTANRNYNIGGWDTSNATNMAFMFRNSIVGDDLSGWDVSKVRTFRNMFYQWGTNTTYLSTSNKLDIKIDSWNPRSATNIQNMFKEAGSSSYIANINTNGWRMPQMVFNSNLSNTSQQAWMDWNISSNGYSNIDWLLGVPGISMPVIEPGYEPTYTIFVGDRNDTSTSNRSSVQCRNVDKIAKSDGTGVQTVQRDQYTNHTEFRLYSEYKEMQVDLFENSEEGNLRFNRKPYGTDGENRNWTFMEPYGPHPELMNKPTNMAQVFTPTNTSERFLFSNVSGFQFINTSNVENMQGMYEHQNKNGSSSNNDISGWDVSNVTNMDHMFANSSTPSFGDLSNWCVRNVTSKPSGWPGRSDDIVTVDPLWGQCPSDPDFVPPAVEGVMPDGPWNDYKHSFMIVTNQSNFIFFPEDRYAIWDRAKDSEDPWVYNSQEFGANLRANKEYIFASNITSISSIQADQSFDFKAADTSNVTNMAQAFSDILQFNGTGLQYFDTSKVTNMYKTFSGQTRFNQDLSEWDVRNVNCSYRFDYQCFDWQSSFKPKFY